MALENDLAMGSVNVDPTGFAGLFALIAASLLIFTIISIIIWIYTSFAFMAIAKKAKLGGPGLAWIPGIGPMIIAFKAADMHWWPWLLFVVIWIPIVNILAMIGLIVMFTIWQWKLFEKIDKPGWWSILCLISPLNLIFWGIAAWSD